MPMQAQPLLWEGTYDDGGLSSPFLTFLDSTHETRLEQGKYNTTKISSSSHLFIPTYPLEQSQIEWNDCT
jgi:hypothetical protein